MPTKTTRPHAYGPPESCPAGPLENACRQAQSLRLPMCSDPELKQEMNKLPAEERSRWNCMGDEGIARYGAPSVDDIIKLLR